MTFIPKNDSGALFRNKGKTDERHADYSGNIIVGTRPYFLDAWLKTAKNGERYISLRLKAKGGQADDSVSF